MSTKEKPTGSGLPPGSTFFSKYRQYIIFVLLIASIALAVLVNIIYGVETVYTHFFYLPIILTALWYHRKAVYLALFFALMHIFLGIQTTGMIVPSTIPRALMFMTVALVLGTLSGARKRLYDRVRSSEMELRYIFNGVYDAIFIHDLEGRIIDVNDRMLGLYGVTKDEALRMSFVHDYSSQENPIEWVREAWKKVIAGENRQFEWIARRPHDGSTFPVEVYLCKIRLQDRDVILATIRDITARKQVEVERSRLSSELQQLLESTDEGIYGVDTRGLCTIMNWSGAKMLGYTSEELIGKDIHTIIHYKKPDGSPYPKESCKALMSVKTSKGCRISDEVFWRRDGTSFPVEYSSYPIVKNGNVTGSVVSFFDITARKKADKELWEAKKRAELYVDLMGHDINNLNQLGIGYLEVALNTLKLGEEGMNILQRALDAMKNSSDLIENVRKIQHIRAEEHRHEVMDLGEILSKVKAEFSEVPGREVTIEYLPVAGSRVNASVLLKEAFRNLVSNAIKHSAGPIRIWIKLTSTTENGKSYHKVDIEDNGPGIPDELKRKLFTRAVSGSSTGGRGLGLFLARALVEDACGRIWVEDRVPGDPTKGSRFVVLLPVSTG